MLSEISNDVVEFTSASKYERYLEVDTKSTVTDPIPPKRDASVNSVECSSIGTQTGRMDTLLFCRDYDEKKLINFLQSVRPIMERELEIGLTPVCGLFSSDNEMDSRSQSVVLHQQISIKEYLKPFKSDLSVRVFATWLSISMNDAPHFALSLCRSHENWCEHNMPSVLIFSPNRDRGGKIIYSQSTLLPVKSCVKVFATLKRNKDIFAAGTVLGDLYVWEMTSISAVNPFKLIASESTKKGEIVAMSWLQSQTAKSVLITGHADGMVFAWKLDELSGQFELDKTFNLFKQQRANEIVVITAIESVSIDGFCVGTDTGKLVFCSVNQLVVVRGAVKQYDPSVQETELPGKTAINFLECISKSDKIDLIVGDFKGNIFIYSVLKLGNKLDANLLFRTMSPFQNKVAIGRDLNVFVLTEKANVQIYGLKSKVNAFQDIKNRYSNEDGNLIRISDNNQWLLTGISSESLYLYKIVTD